MEFQQFVASHSTAGHFSSLSHSLSPWGCRVRSLADHCRSSLPLPIWLVSGRLRKTSLLHLPSWPSPPHLFNLLCLPNWHGTSLVIVPTNPPHLLVQPDPPHLPVRPLLLLPGHPSPAHWTDPAHLLISLALGLLLTQPGSDRLHAQAGLAHLLACLDLWLP